MGLEVVAVICVPVENTDAREIGSRSKSLIWTEHRTRTSEMEY